MNYSIATKTNQTIRKKRHAYLYATYKLRSGKSKFRTVENSFLRLICWLKSVLKVTVSSAVY